MRLACRERVWARWDGTTSAPALKSDIWYSKLCCFCSPHVDPMLRREADGRSLGSQGQRGAGMLPPTPTTLHCMIWVCLETMKKNQEHFFLNSQSYSTSSSLATSDGFDFLKQECTALIGCTFPPCLNNSCSKSHLGTIILLTSQQAPLTRHT